MISILPNSEDWNCRNGSGIQRRAPWIGGIAVDDQVQRDHDPEQRVLELAQPRVVESAEHRAPPPARRRRRAPGAGRRTADGRDRMGGGALERHQRAGRPARAPPAAASGRSTAARGTRGPRSHQPAGSVSHSQRRRAPGHVRPWLAEEPLARGSGAPPERPRRRRSRPSRRSRRRRSACWSRSPGRSRHTTRSRAGRCTGRCRSCRTPARGSCPNTSAEVPPGCEAASRRARRIVLQVERVDADVARRGRIDLLQDRAVVVLDVQAEVRAHDRAAVGERASRRPPSCSGVTWTSPWPTARLTLSPDRPWAVGPVGDPASARWMLGL